MKLAINIQQKLRKKARRGYRVEPKSTDTPKALECQCPIHIEQDMTWTWTWTWPDP